MEAQGPSTTSTVSASGVEAIETTLEVKPQLQISNASIEQVFDIELTVDELLKGGWTRVCLQFPDELLHDSVKVFKAIRRRLPDHVELYVMADTTYGSCCVDEVAAQHVDGQVVVHYGHACLSAPARLSVLYVFPKAPINPKHAAEALHSEVQANADAIQDRRNLLIMSDVSYYWQLDDIYEQLRALCDPSCTLIKSEIDTKAFLHPAANSKTPEGDAATRDPTRKTACGQERGACCQASSGEQTDCCQEAQRQVPEEPAATPLHAKSSCRSYSLPSGVSLKKDCTILYIGPESLTLNNLLITHPTVPIISYAPSTLDEGKSGEARLESTKTNRLLMKRYGIIQKARDADVYGIVVGTLGVSSYLPTLAYLRKLLKKHQKKSYTMAVGKLTPAKLGNFLEVESWVLVACGENSLVEGHKEFMKPIITPWELEVALGERDWLSSTSTETDQSGYTLDFSRVLSDSQMSVEDSSTKTEDGDGGNERDDPEGPVFSTVTGQYRYRKTYGGKQDIKDASDLASQAKALSIRDNRSALSTVLNSAGGEYMATRTYKGLDPRYGEDLPATMEVGRSGVAKEYGGDLEAKAAKLEDKQATHHFEE